MASSLLAREARAQAGATARDTTRDTTRDGAHIEWARIGGRVLDERGRPLAATVRTTAGAPLARRVVRADGAGRFTLVVPARPDGYLLVVEQLGYRPRTVAVARATAGDHSLGDLRLERAPLTLDTAYVRDRRRMEPPARYSPGDMGEGMYSLVLDGQPIEGGNLADVARLIPGVHSTGDSSALGVVIAGQPPAQSSMTLDGASFGAGRVPQEALRSAAVHTSTYDVSRGQFSGGLVAATTRAGTNVWSGAASTTLGPGWLQYGTLPGRVLGRPWSSWRLDAGGGGPLRRDRLLVYGAAQATTRLRDARSLERSDAGTLERLGLATDSVACFQRILRELGASAPAGSGQARVVELLSIGRIDAALGAGQTLTARADASLRTTAGLATSPLALASSALSARAGAAGLLAQLASDGDRWRNEARAYVTASEQRTTPALRTPAGLVWLSTSTDGARSLTPLRFGGAGSSGGRARARTLELSDHLVRSTDERTRLSLGGTLLLDEATLADGDESGTFTFASLAALAEARPQRFARTLGAPPRSARVLSGAVWAGHERPLLFPGLTVTYGVRGEWMRAPAGGVMEAALDSPARATRRSPPPDVAASPRVGFSWEAPRGAPRWLRGMGLRGGAGEFVGRLGASTVAGVGRGEGVLALDCVGEAVPAPEWDRWTRDPADVDVRCTDGTPASDAVPRVTRFDDAYRRPRTRRASLRLGTQLASRLWFHLDALAVRGLDQPSAVDRNLRRAPAFTLAAEDDRPVFAPASSIEVAGGAIPLAASRDDPSLGVVRLLGSRGRSSTAQLVGGLTWFTRRFSIASVQYSLTRSRDLMWAVPAPGASGASTAGDPARPAWGASEYVPRHLLQGTFFKMLGPRTDLRLLGRWQSGLPFTPMADADVDGDGLANDRAMVFRAGADTSHLRGMGELLAGASPRVRRCLSHQLGRIAERSSCRAAPTLAVDAGIRMRQLRADGSQRATLLLVATNLFSGLDYLLHGPDGLHGWGQVSAVDRTLLHVRGFDPARGAFRYDANPWFGRSRAATVGLRQPFALSLQLRVALGADPSLQPITDAVAPLRQARQSVRALRPRVAAQLPNVPALVLDQERTLDLGLTGAQGARLRAVADSLQPLLDQAADSLADAIARIERRDDAATQEARVRALTAGVRAVVEAGVRQARATLTEAQWRRLPTAIQSARVDRIRLVEQRSVR